MKARLLSPDDVDAVLELISNSHNHENRNRNAAENDNTALEINFGVPGQPPIRITSPDQLRTAIPTGGENNGHFELELDFGELIRRTLDYEACQIDAARLAELLRHSSALLNGNKMTHLTLNKLDLRQSLDAFWNVFGQDCCSQLRHVVAKQCLWDMNQWVQQGLIRVPRLQSLHLGRFMGVAPAPPRLTLPNISSLLQQKRNTIQELNLGFVKVPSPNSIVDFCVALGQCSTLRHLSCDNMVGSSYGPSALDDDVYMISAEQIHQTIGQTIAQATTSLKELTLPVLGKGSLEPIAHGFGSECWIEKPSIATCYGSPLASEDRRGA
ncbi:expressed unknown protein [Seminavis robusta]|uniref:Uncharacterized protein n=1 Tax=Seminavis robusta TaxID=568900 RepID=A0A9N8HDM6_9STRA|nr:expressed unknown protein [Seminavis robusta]|eukprot:Sro265_g102920.1 n/a (326) ;mRNA; f:70196-71173